MDNQMGKIFFVFWYYLLKNKEISIVTRKQNK